MGLGGKMKIYNDEYTKYIDDILKKLEEDYLKKEKSRSDTGQKDEDTCKTQDE
jgi:hypothetical protein